MELPKLVYEDLYKFTMSLGAILFVLGVAGMISHNRLDFCLILMVLLFLIFAFSIWIMQWAFSKWYMNQKLLDRKLKAETALIEKETALIEQDHLIVPNKSASSIQKVEVIMEEAGNKLSVARVLYKITSSLPNSVPFEFVKDHKVWFWIFNYDPIKYLAYIKIKFITDGFERESDSDYYGGLKAWKLNAYSGIQAPGLVFPKKIKDAVSQGRTIKVEIRCNINDEFDKLVEEKFSQTYAYNLKTGNWFLEP